MTGRMNFIGRMSSEGEGGVPCFSFFLFKSLEIDVNYLFELYIVLKKTVQ